MKSVILPKSIECIKIYCFISSHIRRAIIPKSVRLIGDRTFYNCKILTSVTLQEGLESIGDEGFSGECDWYDNNNAPQIREITIPKTVKSIG